MYLKRETCAKLAEQTIVRQTYNSPATRTRRHSRPRRREHRCHKTTPTQATLRYGERVECVLVERMCSPPGGTLTHEPHNDTWLKCVQTRSAQPHRLQRARTSLLPFRRSSRAANLVRISQLIAPFSQTTSDPAQTCRGNRSTKVFSRSSRF